MSAESIATNFVADHPAVQIVLEHWVDICGVVRQRMLPVQRFLDLIKRGASLQSGPLAMTVTTTGDVLPEFFYQHFTGRGNAYLDVSSLRTATHDSAGIGNAAFIISDSDWSGLDARLNLKRMVSKAQKDHGMKFLVGFELELCFLRPQSLEPAGPGPEGIEIASSTYRYQAWPMLNEMIVAIAEGGIICEQVHKEHGISQWEFSLPPMEPLKSVDALIYSREVIKNIAYKHGVVATTYPAPYSGSGDGQKSGLHLHISAEPLLEMSDWDPDTVMAGILSHVPELMAIGMSQIDSYTRAVPGTIAAGGLLGWGRNNRDLPVRQIENNHWEIRIVDGTANLYAMVAGLVSAATDRKPLTLGNVTSECESVAWLNAPG
jgi:glutamine synthetase